MNKQKRNPHAVALGKRGGKARAKNLTPEQLSESGKKAVKARWDKYRASKTK